MEEPDPAALAAAQAGDVAAFERLVRLYQVPVWRFLRHLVGDADLAEDLAQETFLRVHGRLASFDGRAKLSTWILQVARNAGIDALRRRQRDERLLRALPPPRPPSSPEASAELTAAILSLEESLREAVLSVEVLGLTYDEAGTVIGVPPGTVKSRVFRARRQLGAWMADEPERADEV